MKATELRIGNWVTFEPDNGNFIVSQIDAHNTWSKTINGLCLEDIKPIPLTEEWLLKFGFKKDKILGSYIKNYFRFHTQRPNGDNKGFTLVTEIYWCKREVIVVGGVEHVNQLQNLHFALTNKELKIT